MSQNAYNLSPDQRRLINMYIIQYNQTNNHIEHLFDMLDEIRGNIQNIISNSQPRSIRTNRYSRQTNLNNRTFNSNNLLDNNLRQNHIFYDYFSPINRSLYTIPQENEINNINSFLSNFFNTSVVIRPTVQQIDNATRLLRYADIVNPITDRCPISLETFESDSLVRQICYCGHIFSQESFDSWFQNSVRCPVCRYDIRNHATSENSTNPSNNNNNNPNNNNNNNNNNTNNNNNNTNNNTNTNTNNNSNTINTNTNATNFNVLRDPETNQIEQVSFDISRNELTNNIINNITTRLFNNIFTETLQNSTNDRYFIDPSNNLFFYETIIRPNNRQQ